MKIRSENAQLKQNAYFFVKIKTEVEMILLFVEYFWANVDKFLRPV